MAQVAALPAATAGTPALRARALTVAFNGNRVLDSASLDVQPGTVHALLGQNGSGKSTLLKVLSGVYSPEPGGTLAIGGINVPLPTSPDQVRGHGLAIVHQDLGLAADLTVLENIRLRLFRTGAAWSISWRQERRLAAEALARYGVDIPVDRKVSEISPAERTVVAVVRALEEMSSAGRKNVLILDEPTPHLTRDEAVWLFQMVRTVAAEGTGVILVTHRLEEVFEVGDEVTVLRDGQVALTYPVQGLGQRDLTHAVLGRELTTFQRSDDAAALAGQQPAAAALHAQPPDCDPWKLEIRAGEILGVTGLIGSGWEPVPYVFFGADRNLPCTVDIGGTVTAIQRWTPRRAIAADIALIPRDRPTLGALNEFSLTENLTLLELGSYFRAGLLRPGEERHRAAELAAEFDIRPGDPDMQFRLLSGGNQQKALLAKWWQRHPKLILLDEPTQGIDVGARARVYELILAAANAGAAILIASVEYEELAKICTRVVVFRDGVPSVTLESDEVTQDAIAQACYEGAGTGSTVPGGSTSGRRSDDGS